MNTEELDAFAALVNRFSGNQPQKPVSGSREWAGYLLSPERAQRFELLLHLIANLGQPMVVCGPEGIGKTTFLGLLTERALAGWRVVPVPVDGDLVFDGIIAHIAAKTGISSATGHAVAEFLQQQARNKGVLVLVLDEAGQLTPGVINALWQFARQYPALRLVMALRPDEAHLKTATDGVALGDCHFIDIPALTEPLCEAYLRRLATQPPRLLSLEEVTASRVHHIYQDSHGVPGRILRLLAQTPPRPDRTRRYRLILVLAVCVAAGVAVALSYYRYSSVTAPTPVTPMTAPAPTGHGASVEPKPTGDISTPPAPPPAAPAVLSDPASWLAAQKALDGWLVSANPQSSAQPPGLKRELPHAAAGGIAAPTPSPRAIAPHHAVALPPPAAAPDKPPAPATGAQPQPTPPPTEPATTATPAPSSPTSSVIEQLLRTMGHQAATAPATTVDAPPPGSAPATAGHTAPSQKEEAGVTVEIPGLNGPDWLLNQAPQSFTLRIMSARESASLKTLLERYPVMKGRLAAFKKRSGSGVWHQVYYGVFASAAEAQQAATELPAFLGKPKPVQMKWVQQEIPRHP